MIRPTVEVILTYVDKLTAPLRGTSTGVRGMFSDMTKSVTSFVGGFLAFGSITAYMRAAWEAADRFTQSLARVEGTAKIVGVPLEEVQRTARLAQEQFGLGATAANNFASSAVTMAAKAGDVTKSGELMAAVLNLAAARGITAEEALEALNITLKGQDEGLDKLVQKNPSAYYDSWAKAAGRSAGSLTDLEKKLAIVDGLISDGGPVRGAYTDWLETTAGKAFLASQAMEQANARFGVATESLRNLLLGAKTWAAEAIGSVVEFFQKLAVDFALAWDIMGSEVRRILGGIMQSFGEFITNSHTLQVFLTDGMVAMAEKMANSGNRMKNDAIRDRGQLEQIRREMYAEIEGVHAAAELSMTAVTEQEGAARTDANAKELAKQRADAEKAFGAISDAFIEAFRGEIHPAVKEAEKAIRDISAALAEQQGLTAVQRAELLKMLDAYDQQRFLVGAAIGLEEDLKRVRDLPFQEQRLAAINDLLARATRLRNEEGANASTVAYYDKLIADLTKASGEELSENVALQRGIADASRQAALAYAMLSGDVVTVARLSREIAGHTEDAKEGWYEIDDSVLNAARGGVSLAKEMGLVDDRSASVLNNVINLTDILQKGLGSLAAGDVIGAIGSLAGVIGGLFGESPEARAQKQLLQRNTDALQRLAQVNGLLLTAQTPGAKIEKFQDLTSVLGGLSAGGDSAVASRARLNAFRAALMSKGLTISDAEQMAKDMGMEGLGISDGKLTGSSLAQFVQFLSTADFSAFQNSFAGFLDRIDFEGRIAGGMTPEQEISRIRDALGQEFGSSVLSQQFAGLDLNSAEGRQALLTRLLDIGANVESLSPGQRGGLTGQEFTDILVRLTDLLRESLETTTGTGTTVPAAPTTPTGSGTVPATPEVDVPTTPAAFTTGTATNLGDLLGGKLDTLIDQGKRMLTLQEAIREATEATAEATAILARRGGASASGDALTALDLMLQAEMDRTSITQGGG